MKTFQLGGLNITISQSVFETLHRYKQFKPQQHEAGGILLGQIKGNHVYILRVSVPTKFDKSSRTSFVRSKIIAQIIIDYEFVNSGNRTIYLGEWHTHPEKFPSPSGTDKSMIHDQFKLNKLNEPFILLLIQGIDGFYLAKYDGSKLISIDCYE
jgi:integrative and conjugative element protein (TIGR02256 family)